MEIEIKFMKVIFLDHDGVICLPKQWGSREKKRLELINKENIHRA